MTIRTLILSLAILLSSLSFGQSYLPTIEEGKKWSINWPNNPVGSDIYFPQITCDTIQRNGKIYNYIRCDYGSCNYDNYIREDTLAQQVFYIDPGPNEEEKLFLDYSLEVGDTFSYLPSYTPDVDSVYTAFLFGRVRKVIAFDSLLTFIEGVGSSFHGPLPGTAGFSWVNSVGEVACDEIFTDTKDLSDSNFSPNIYPNPSQGIFQIELDLKESDPNLINLQIWTLMGELVFEKTLSSSNSGIDLSALKSQTLVARIISPKSIFSQILILLD